MTRATPSEPVEPAPIRIERRGVAAVVTLDRPGSRNAVSRTMAAALVDALDELSADPDVRAVVLTGAGEQAFCAGADLKERATMSEAEVRRFLADLGRALELLETMPKPVIAAINGFALGGGLELALACDLRLAATSATLGLTEVRLGIIPGGGGTQRLPRIVGVARAKELVFTGRRIAADEAERIGLVNRVCQPEALLDEAVAIADEIALGGPLAIAQAKFAIDHGMQADLHTGLAIERKAYETLLPTRDRVEALQAFRDKRPPRFEGR